MDAKQANELEPQSEISAPQQLNSVVHKDKNGTITVQSKKTVGGCNYSFVSVSPT